MSERENKLRKLRALLALAANNPNEAEAMAAIAKANDYAALHGINLSDVATDAKRDKVAKEYATTEPLFSGFGDSPDKRNNWQPVDWYLWKQLAFFCDVKVRTTITDEGYWAVQYAGHEVDLELVQYLRKVINFAMHHGWKAGEYLLPPEAQPQNFIRQPGLHKKAVSLYNTAMHSFFSGMAERLRERMTDVRLRQTEAAVPTDREQANALVVVKRDMLAAYVKSVGFKETEGSYGATYASDAGMRAYGRAKGDSVDLGRGVGNGSKVKALGR